MYFTNSKSGNPVLLIKGHPTNTKKITLNAKNRHPLKTLKSA